MLDLYIKGGMVMHVIFLVSIVALAIIIERCWYFFCIRENVEESYEELKNGLSKGISPPDLVRIHNIEGPIGKALLQGIAQWERGEKAVREAMAIPGEMLISAAARGLPLLALIASLSVMLGLLGTVTGLVKSFHTVASMQGQVSPAALASGIWAALLTTAAGLSVAIVVSIAHHIFDRRVSSLVLRLEQYANKLLLFGQVGDSPMNWRPDRSAQNPFPMTGHYTLEKVSCSD